MSILQMVIDKFSRSYTQYRFDSISNFLSYEQFQEKEAIEKIIRLGKELEIMMKFKDKTSAELSDMVDVWQEQDNISMSNELFDKYRGIDAYNELSRRRDIETRNFYENEAKKKKGNT